jgi:serine/threonine protein kinase
MPISSGTRLGAYEILSQIGAGGMGEVYKARDTRLDREVAIKVLPEHLSRNSQSRERFEREAKAISTRPVKIVSGASPVAQAFSAPARFGEKRLWS